jgi:aromatic ring-opening dioxygenase catalytic subunit (LigB family)
VIVAATVHFPYMTAWPERAPSRERALTLEGFDRLAKAFQVAGVETIVAFTSEHIVNLQPRLTPPFVVGVGESHAAFPEPHFNLDPVTQPGDPELAHHLVRTLYRDGFDVAHSSELRLDHGTTLPLALLKVAPGIALVPVIINSIFPPLPTLDRCRALGEAVGHAIRNSGLKRRVGILATGGLSHTVGAPGPARNDPDFDGAFVRALMQGNLDGACDHSDAELDVMGNGTHEIRNWIAAAAAACPQKGSVVTALSHVQGWDTGVYQMIWENN